MKKYAQYVLALGHLCSDINQSILSAVLPFLIASYHYDYTTAALLVTVSNVFGSIVQPIFGSISDKKNKPWIMMLGVSLACLGMALTGLTSKFYGLCIATIISGVGVAMFHPQAAKLVNQTVSKNKQGRGMSVFSFGGKIGFTLGPIATAFFITHFGMKGTLFFLLPGVIFSIVCGLFYKNFEYEKVEEIVDEKRDVQEVENWPAFFKLCVIVFSRSIISNGMSTFLALYFIQKFTTNSSLANTILSIYYGIGALVTLFGGGFGDRYGYRKIVAFSFILFLPAMFLFTLTDQMLLAVCMLVFLTAGESLSYSPMVVLGQHYLPKHTGFASGVTLGLAVSVGAVICPLLGVVSDHYGLTYAFYMIMFVSLVALLFSMLLPKEAAH